MRRALPFRLYFRKNVGIWYYRLPEQGRWRSTGKTTRAEAQRYLLEQVLPGAPPPSRATGRDRELPLRLYAPRALEAYTKARAAAGKPLSAHYLKSCRRYLERFLVADPLANRIVSEIRPADFEAFQVRLLEKLAERRTTAIRALEVVRLILRRAEKLEHIGRSPDRPVDAVHHVARERGTLSDEELAALFPADPWAASDFTPWADALDYTAFLVAAATGMRRNEVLALQWSSVHLQEEQEYLEIRGSALPFGKTGPTKGRRPRATPIFDFVLWPDRRAVLALRELRKLLVSEKIIAFPGAPEASGGIFAYPGGNRLGPTGWGKRWKRAIKKAGIDRNRGEGLLPADPHTLRHTLASHLKAAGLGDDLIRRFCGWSSLGVQSRYTHIEPEIFARILDLVKATS